MAAKIIDGIAVSRYIREECRSRVEALQVKSGIKPGLAVILVGDNPASLLYVRNKLKACEEIGIRSYRFDFPASVEQAAVLRMEFKAFLHAFLLIPVQVVRTSRRLIFRLLAWNPWQAVFLRGFDQLCPPLEC